MLPCLNRQGSGLLSSIVFRQHQEINGRSSSPYTRGRPGLVYASPTFGTEDRKTTIRKAATDSMAAYWFSDGSLLLEDAGYAVGAVDDAG